jgi:hypothetical protein
VIRKELDRALVMLAIARDWDFILREVRKLEEF